MFKTLVLALFTAGLPLQGTAAAASLNLETVLNAVRQRNPELAAARAQAREADGMALMNYAWMPPRLGLEVMGMPWPSPDLGAGMARRYVLSQELPFPGRTLLGGRAATHRARAMQADAAMKEQSLLQGARQAYYQLAGIERSLAGLERADEANREMAALSAKRGSFGQLDRMGQFMDTMLAMEKADVDSMRPMLLQQQRAAKARLAALMGQDPATEMASPALDLDAWLKVPLPTRQAVLAAAEAANPEMLAAREQVKAAEAGRVSAWAGWLPDLMLEGAVIDNANGMQESSAMLTLSLPWVWAWKQGGEVKAAHARVDGAGQGLESVRLRVQEQALTALDELAALTEALRITWTKTYPLAAEGLKLARSGFRTTALGAGEILMAVTDYRMTEEKLGKLIAERGQALAMLEMLTAGALTTDAAKEEHHD